MDLAATVPDGIVCFFVSYLYMDTIVSRWNDMGILQVRSRAGWLGGGGGVVGWWGWMGGWGARPGRVQGPEGSAPKQSRLQATPPTRGAHCRGSAQVPSLPRLNPPHVGTAQTAWRLEQRPCDGSGRRCHTPLGPPPNPSLPTPTPQPLHLSPGSQELMQHKLVFIETQDVVETTLALDNFRRACDCGRGAVFFRCASSEVLAPGRRAGVSGEPWACLWPQGGGRERWSRVGSRGGARGAHANPLP